MANLDLVCRDCGHQFEVLTRVAIRERQKRCPECASREVRQTFASFLRNGSLKDPSCGAPPQRSSGFG
jgi:putative FmdB family regulatory protein